MFGADAAQASILENERQGYETKQQDTFEYLFPKFTKQSPWQQIGQNRNRPLLEDFILIAEFSEQEGPRPVIVIPKDGGQNFDQNEFSVKILAVDHQSSIVEGCEMTEDAQVVMSDPDRDTHAFIHHIVLNDIQARGYVRPFCISYVTSDPLKIMKCYEEISSQLRKVARLMKYGNRLVFMRDLEKHQEDLSYTKAHLLLSQSRAQMSAQSDNELLNVLNTLRQCMEEVKDILSNLKPLIQVDTELSERFQFYERELKSKHRHEDTDSDSSSLKDFGSKSDVQYTPSQLSGSYTDRATPEFSLFSKIKDEKPKILDVSTIRGKRRFDRSLRGLHELCSWGAKEGLQRLRAFREFLKRDLASIYVDELDMSALVPEKGVLCFSNSTVGANFLSTSGRIRNSCCVKRKMSEMTFHHASLTSLGSVESFKSLSSSFQSFYDEEIMYSANSSMVVTPSSGCILDRQISELSATGQEGSGQDDPEVQFPHDNFLDTSNFFEVSENDWTNSLLATLKTGEVEFDLESNEKNKLNTEENSKKGSLADTSTSKDFPRERSNTTNSDFDNIDIERDLECKARGCACEKEKRSFEGIKCNIKVNCAKVENKNVNMIECNDRNETGESNVFKVGIVEETDKEVGDTATSDGITKEYNSDLTPVTTDSNSSLCDQFAAIFDNDNHSSTENKVECMNYSIFPITADKERSENGSELLADAKDTVNKNDKKANAIQQTATQANVSSDNGLVMDNLCDKQTSLDFEIISKKQSNEELGKKEGENKEPEFGHMSYKHQHSIQSEMRSFFGDRERTSGMDASKSRKWKFMHPFKNILDGECSIGQSLQKVISNYNNLQHIVYSLLTGRPVVVIGTRRQEVAVKELVQALSVFVPYTPRSSSMGLLCQLKQLKMSDIHTFQLRGVIKSDKRSVDYLVPKSVRRYVTLVDTEKGTLYCQPYQGILLNFIASIHNKKKTFKSDTALLTFVQLCLQEISTKAFNFYHTVTASNEQVDFSGATLPHKSSMLELSMEKYLNRAGVLNSDCRIIKHLTEIVKLQQIEEEFGSKYLTDAPSCPFSVSYLALQTYRL